MGPVHPGFGAALSEADWLASRHLARRFGLSVVDHPRAEALPAHPLSMTWHTGRRTDAGHAWLRAVIEAATAEGASPKTK